MSLDTIVKPKKQTTTTVKMLIDQLSNPKPVQKNKKYTKPQLDVETIRAQMKSKWKDPGYCNMQFDTLPTLKAKLLSDWQISRMYEAERSYKHPKTYKGIKFDQHSRPFNSASEQMFSKKFKVYLNKVKDQYKEKQFGPDPALDTRASRIKRMLTENHTRSTIASNSSQTKTTTGFFGFSQQRFKMNTIH